MSEAIAMPTAPAMDTQSIVTPFGHDLTFASIDLSAMSTYVQQCNTVNSKLSETITKNIASLRQQVSTLTTQYSTLAGHLVTLNTQIQYLSDLVVEIQEQRLTDLSGIALSLSEETTL